MGSLFFDACSYDTINSQPNVSASFIKGFIVGQVCLVVVSMMVIYALFLWKPMAVYYKLRSFSLAEKKRLNFDVPSNEESCEWLNLISSMISKTILHNQELIKTVLNDKVAQIDIERYKPDFLGFIDVQTVQLNPDPPVVCKIVSSHTMLKETANLYSFTAELEFEPALIVELKSELIINKPVASFGSIPIHITASFTRIQGMLAIDVALAGTTAEIDVYFDTPPKVELDVKIELGDGKSIVGSDTINEIIVQEIRRAINTKLVRPEKMHFSVPIADYLTSAANKKT